MKYEIAISSRLIIKQKQDMLVKSLKHTIWVFHKSSLNMCNGTVVATSNLCLTLILPRLHFFLTYCWARNWCPQSRDRNKILCKHHAILLTNRLLWDLFTLPNVSYFIKFIKVHLGHISIYNSLRVLLVKTEGFFSRSAIKHFLKNLRICRNLSIIVLIINFKKSQNMSGIAILLFCFEEFWVGTAAVTEQMERRMYETTFQQHIH